MSSNKTSVTGVSYIVLGVLIAAVAVAIISIGVKLYEFRDDLATTMTGGVVFLLGLASLCHGFVLDRRARQGD